MDEELVRDSSSDNDGDAEKSVSPFPYTDFMKKQCPIYMAMGMTYTEYWDGDNDLPIYYREKAKLERRKKNYEAWLQGAYIYRALLAVAPSFNALAKDNTPSDYSDELIPETEEEVRELELERKKKEQRKQMERLKAQAIKINEKLKKEGGGK